VKSLSSWAEFAVGGSLIAIGALGIKEARNWKAEDEAMELAPSEVIFVAELRTGSPTNAIHTQSSQQANSTPRSGGKRAIVLNGILHGFSWDGTPSLAPALALPSLGAVLVFLFAYCGGTVLAMSAVTTIIGEGSLRVGEKLDRVNHAIFARCILID
jgi:hypothetical protein